MPKPRPWFQIHLSTAVVLMIVSGGLLWANLRRQPVPIFQDVSYFYEQGWPCVVHIVILRADPLVLSPDAFDFPISPDDWSDFSVFSKPPQPISFWSSLKARIEDAWNSTKPYRPAATDAAVALAILALTALLSEWRIRRAWHARSAASAGPPS